MSSAQPETEHHSAYTDPAGGSGEDPKSAAQQAMVDLDRLLCDYVHFPQVELRWTCVIWAAHTFLYDATDVEGYHLFGVVPYLWIKSAGRDSGKTTLADLLVMVVSNGERTDSMSAASLFRRLAKGAFTPFFDEADNSIPASSTDDDGGRLLLAVLNSGFRRGGHVERVDKRTLEPEKFPTFGPKAIVGIKVPVADTLASRCIPILLERAKLGELRLRWRERQIRPRAEDIRTRLAHRLPELRTSLPPDAEDRLGFIANRAFDIWEALYSTARSIGGPWPDRCVEAARLLTQTDVSMSVGEQLLHDMLVVFEESGEPDFLSTNELLGVRPGFGEEGRGLFGLDGSMWPDYRRRGLNATSLASILGEYGVKPGRDSFTGGKKGPRGYNRVDLEQTWGRWGRADKVDKVSVDPVHASATEAATALSSGLEYGAGSSGTMSTLSTRSADQADLTEAARVEFNELLPESVPLCDLPAQHLSEGRHRQLKNGRSWCSVCVR